MADVQLEHGHFKLANRLAEAILSAGFGVTQLHIVLALFRVTYGWRRSTVKCTETELAVWAGMEPGPDVTRASGTFRQGLKLLIEAGVVQRVEGARGARESTFSIQKDYTKWGRYSSAEARLQSIYGSRPKSDDPALRSIQRAKQDASDMAQEQATLNAPPADAPSMEGGPDTGHVEASDMAQPQATSKTTWPDTGPSRGPLPGHVTAPKSLNGETYEAGKTLKDSSTPLTITDHKTTASIFSASDAAENGGNAAAADSGKVDERPPVESPTPAARIPEPQRGGTTGERRADPPPPAPTRARAADDPAVVYATGMSTAANAGIGYRWFQGENPHPVHYTSGVDTAEKLIAAGVPLELARATIVSVCHASKQAKPPRTLSYFLEPILEAYRDAEQRLLNERDREQQRGGAPARMSSVMAAPTPGEIAAEDQLRQAYDVERRSAALVWGKDPANKPAYAEIMAEVHKRYENLAASPWRDKGLMADLIKACAEKAGFPDFENWKSARAAAAGSAA